MSFPDQRDRMWLPFQIVQEAARVAEQHIQRTVSDVVFCENKMRVLRYSRAPGQEHAGIPFVMAAPIVMRHYIMDLRPGRSLVQYLVSRGIDVFMIDWGTPDASDRYEGLDDYVIRYFKHAVQAVCRIAEVNGVILHGYCQGGLLATLYTALYPDHVRALVNQAGPIDFSDQETLSMWARRLNVDLLVDTLGNMPAEMLLASFHMVNPTGALAQTLRYLENMQDDAFVEDYVAMNSWLNDVVPLPGEFFRRFIKDLYQRNLLVKGDLEIAGRCVKLSKITCPVLTITSEKDQIVSARSASALNDLVGSEDKQLILMRGGHLGMTIGRGAWNELWPTLADWVLSHANR